MSKIHERLQQADLTLPEPWRLPDGVHRAFELIRLHGDAVYVSGHGPVDGSAVLMMGKVGAELAVEDGVASARATGLAVISSLRRVVPDLDALTWLRATVYVNAIPGLDGPSLTQIGDGFSDVVNEVFGARGRHARATLGVASLAFNVPTIAEASLVIDGSRN
jgi:enamine deaminase RidA (YjgF/YER057c/UK114 family)